MKSCLVTLICMLVGLASPALWAQEAPMCPLEPTAIVFANGIYSTHEDGRDALFALQQRLADRLSPEDMADLEFAMAYNGTNGILLDLFEAIQQRLANDLSDFAQFLANVLPLPEFFQDEAQNLAMTVDEATFVVNADLANHVAFYRALLEEDKRVVVVSHSQGNFYANNAFALLFPDDSASATERFRIVSVANPARFVAGDQAYTTLEEDLIITVIIGALGANITNENSVSALDRLGHSFIDAYLIAGSDSEAQILDDVITALRPETCN